MNNRGRFSLLGAWALAFGCALGWDALSIPWTTLLPAAGPLGTAIGVLAGGLAMALVAWNFHFLLNRRPGPGGVYAYAKAAFGIDGGVECEIEKGKDGTASLADVLAKLLAGI